MDKKSNQNQNLNIDYTYFPTPLQNNWQYYTKQINNIQISFVEDLNIKLNLLDYVFVTFTLPFGFYDDYNFSNEIHLLEHIILEEN